MHRTNDPYNQMYVYSLTYKCTICGLHVHVFDDQNSKYTLHPFRFIHSAQTFPSQLDAVICSVLCYVMHAVMTSSTCSDQCTMSFQCAIFFLQFASSVKCALVLWLQW